MRILARSPFTGRRAFGVRGSPRATTDLPSFHIPSELCALSASVVKSGFGVRNRSRQAIHRAHRGLRAMILSVFQAPVIIEPVKMALSEES